MRLPYIVLLITCITIPAAGQHFVSVGFGLNLHFFGSDELEEFTDTYNLRNAAGLTSILKGPNRGAFGLRKELAYRYVPGKYGYGIRIGTQENIIRDAAEFAVLGERRRIEYKLDLVFADLEFNRYFGDYFGGLVFSTTFNRKFRIETSYIGPGNINISKPLNGNYQAESSQALEIGLTFGLHREPIVFGIRLSYPLLTSGGEDVLAANDDAKVASGIDRFPANYRDYTDQQPYRSVPANINGFQILITSEFGFGF